MARRRVLVVAAVILSVTSLVFVLSRQDEPDKGPAVRVASEFPMAFEPNMGQADSHVRFMARRPALKVFLTDAATLLTYESFDSREGAAIRIAPRGAAVARPLEPFSPLPGKVNYLLGPDRTKWRLGVPMFAGVTQRNVYRGVDVSYSGTGDTLTCELALDGGADIGAVRLGIEGARSLRLNERGALVIESDAGSLVLPRPSTQEQEVSVEYVLNGPDEIGFRLGAYDGRRPLTVAVPVAFGGSLDGLGFDEADGIAVDLDSAEYVAGRVRLGKLPSQAGPYDPLQSGDSSEIVVAKYAPGGEQVYKTFIGGTSMDRGESIAVDDRGNAYVTGRTRSTDLPVTDGAFDTIFNGGEEDAFALKVGPAGASIEYLTYLGGAATDYAWEIAIDGVGAAYLTGGTYSTDFPTTAGAFDRTLNGDLDIFVTKLSPGGSALGYSTYLGGSGSDGGYDIAVDATGAAYVTGGGSSDFPVTAGVYNTTADKGNGIVVKLDRSGGALVFSTFLAGTRNGAGRGIAVDAKGAVYITGDTSSDDFLATPGAFDTTHGLFSDGFVAKLSPSGSTLEYASYIGGNNHDIGAAIAVDGAGQAYVVASVLSTDVPVTTGPLPILDNPQWVYLAKLDPTGAILFSTAVGGSHSNFLTDMAVDRGGTAHIAGRTSSPEFRSAAVPVDWTLRSRVVLDAFAARVTP